jgi:hypothetical protein
MSLENLVAHLKRLAAEKKSPLWVAIAGPPGSGLFKIFLTFKPLME